RGVYILVLIFGAIGGALALFAWRAPALQGGASFEPVSRETALLLNNLFLAAAVATVFIGTLYPLALDSLQGIKISVGPPYFAITFAPLFAALLVLVPWGPQLSWRKGDPKAAFRALLPALGLAALAGLVVLAFAATSALEAALAFGLAAWVIGASVVQIAGRRRAGTISFGVYASALAHAGLGVTLLGIVGATLWRSESLSVLKPGQTMQVAQYELRLDEVARVQGPNYFADRAGISVMRHGRTIATIAPEKRSFPIEGQAVSDTAIRTTGYEDLYVALGDDRGGGAWVIRAYVNPLAPFIWFGGAIMALGGLASLFGRLRRHVAAAPAKAVLAE